MKVKLDEGAFAPTRAHKTDAGMDLRAMQSCRIPAHGYRTLRTGVHIQLPQCCAGLLVSKSGLNSKCGITSTGLIDAGYSGEIMVTLHNNDPWPYLVSQGQKIANLVIIPIRLEEAEIVDEIETGERGENGFGSTGK